MPDEPTYAKLPLSEDDRLKIMKAIQENNDQMSFLYMLVSRDELTKEAVKTHLDLLRHCFDGLSGMLDAGETLSRELSEANASCREANERARDLEAQLGAGVTATAAASRIRYLANAFHTWMELLGFHYAHLDYSDFGVTARFDSEIEPSFGSEDERMDVTFGDKGLARELAPVVPHAFGPDAGWDTFTTRSGRTHLMFTDRNRYRIVELFEDFPDDTRPKLIPAPAGNPVHVTDFSSRRDEGHFDLRAEVFLSYESIERWLVAAQAAAAAAKAPNGRKGDAHA